MKAIGPFRFVRAKLYCTTSLSKASKYCLLCQKAAGRTDLPKLEDYAGQQIVQCANLWKWTGELERFSKGVISATKKWNGLAKCESQCLLDIMKPTYTANFTAISCQLRL